MLNDIENQYNELGSGAQKVVKYGCGCFFMFWFIFFCVCMGSYVHLGPDEQVLIKTSRGHHTVNGPTRKQLNPFQEKIKRRATLLDPLKYAVIQDRMTARTRIEVGPQLLFLQPYDDLKGVFDKLVLERDEYVRLVNQKDGVERIETGPKTVVPKPTEVNYEGVRRSIYLNMDSAVVIRNKTNGKMTLVTLCNYPRGLYSPAPLEELVELRNLVHVLPHEAMIVRDVNGAMKVYTGTATNNDTDQSCFDTGAVGAGTAFFLQPYSKIVRMAWSTYAAPGEATRPTRRLQPGEAAAPPSPGSGPSRSPIYMYVHNVLRDRQYSLNGSLHTSGSSDWKKDSDTPAFFAFRRAVSGSIPIYEYVNMEQFAHEYSTRSTPKTGWQSRGVAFHAYNNAVNGASAVHEHFNSNNDDYQYIFSRTPPGPNWAYKWVAFYAFRTLRGNHRRLSDRQLSAIPTATEASLYVDQMQASSFSGPKVKIAAIDLRVHKSFYSYEVRTSDNVKLELEGTLFWMVTDVEKMVKMTSDPAGDVWSRARSTLVAAISNTTLEEFMDNFHSFAEVALFNSLTDDFYTKRGIEIANMEMTKFAPVDDHTKTVLQQIVRATVHRINELQKQRSRSDVEVEKLGNDIDLEVNRTVLIQTKAENDRIRLESEGSIDGTKVATEITAFVKGLRADLSNETQRIELYKTHKKLNSTNKATGHVSSGRAGLYIAPEDLELRVQMPEQAQHREL